MDAFFSLDFFGRIYTRVSYPLRSETKAKTKLICEQVFLLEKKRPAWAEQASKQANEREKKSHH